jgi:hypothetical protein
MSEELNDYPDILKNNIENVNYNINQSENDKEFTNLINKKDTYVFSNLLPVISFKKNKIINKMKDIIYDNNNINRNNLELKKKQVNNYKSDINLPSIISSKSKNGFLNIYNLNDNKNIKFEDTNYIALAKLSDLFKTGFVKKNNIEYFNYNKKYNLIKYFYIFLFFIIIIYLILIYN